MKSLWQETAQIPEFPRLCDDISTDVLVIGGGLAGVLTAYCLKEKGIKCVLVESNRLLAKTSGKTTAKIQVQHGLIYSRLIQSYGIERAELYYKANCDAQDSLKKLCKKAGCALEEKCGLVYSQDKAALNREAEALNKIGAVAIFRQELPLPINAVGAVGLSGQGQFNPIELCSCLTKGQNIYENTRVTHLKGLTAFTDFGSIKAQKIVVATHFPFINKYGGYFLKLYQHRSYVLAFEALKPFEDMYVSANLNGLSFSSFKGVMLLSGSGHRTGKSSTGFEELEKIKSKYYNANKELYRWANQDTVSLDGVPYIGSYSPMSPDIYVASGFNKWGMTGSMLSAKIISNLISGNSCDYAEAFLPSRSIIKPRLFINGAEAVKNLLPLTTKRCSHLGCALKYNRQEHSWDCVCHGSRFSQSGKVLDGPANENIRMN